MVLFCSVSSSLSHITLSNKVWEVHIFLKTVSLVFIVLSLWFYMQMYKSIMWLYNNIVSQPEEELFLIAKGRNSYNSKRSSNAFSIYPLDWNVFRRKNGSRCLKKLLSVDKRSEEYSGGHQVSYPKSVSFCSVIMTTTLPWCKIIAKLKIKRTISLFIFMIRGI